MRTPENAKTGYSFSDSGKTTKGVRRNIHLTHDTRDEWRTLHVFMNMRTPEKRMLFSVYCFAVYVFKIREKNLKGGSASSNHILLKRGTRDERLTLHMFTNKRAPENRILSLYPITGYFFSDSRKKPKGGGGGYDIETRNTTPATKD